MNKKIACNEDEYHKIYKILNFRLPNEFKMIGIIGAALILFYLLGSKFLGGNTLLTKDILRSLILFCLFLATMSKDKLEDEYNTQLRFQAYVLAFVITAFYAISIPLIAIILDVIITKVTGDGNINFHQGSSFEVLFMLMAMQLLFFETLKKFGRV